MLVKGKDLNICFIHLPKVAGTSIESAFGWTRENEGKQLPVEMRERHGEAIQHLTVDEYIQGFGNEFLNKTFLFTFVREPRIRFLSYVLKQAAPKSKFGLDPSVAKSPKKLNAWIQGWYREYLRREDQTNHQILKLGPNGMTHALSANGKLADLDFVGYYESLQQDWSKLNALLMSRGATKKPLNLPHLNKKSSTDYREILSELAPESLSIVDHAFNEDISHFYTNAKT